MRPTGQPGRTTRCTRIKLPAGFQIDYCSDRTPNARAMVPGDDGTVDAGTVRQGKVYIETGSGNEKPAEELDQASRAGLHFDHPYCHGGEIPDPEFGLKRPLMRVVTENGKNRTLSLPVEA